MSEQVTRTIYGAALQSALLLGIPYEPAPNSTLNELFEVLDDAVLSDTEYPHLNLLTVGNGGHRSVSGADNIPYIKILKHQPSDGGLFKPLPFVLRPTSSDLTTQQRAQYALRCVQTYNGESYFAYYLKRLDMSAVAINLQKRTVQDGTTTSVDFVPLPSDLVPTPIILSNDTPSDLPATSLVSSAILAVALTAADCEELLNVSRIMYGDDNYAIISEIGMVASSNRTIQLTDNSNFKEAVAAQIVTHLGAYHQVKYTATGIAGIYDVGTNEPLTVVA